MGVSLLLLLALCDAALTPPRTAAAQSPLTVTQVGWGNRIIGDTWAPVHLLVQPPFDDPNAAVEIVLHARQHASVSSPTYPFAAYRQPIALRQGAEQRAVVWALIPSGTAGATARLIAGDRVVAETPFDLPWPDPQSTWAVLGVLADSPAVFATTAQALREATPPAAQLYLANLTPADLPADPTQLGALGGLLVQGHAAEALTDAQRQALYRWVTDGGSMVLFAGPDNLAATDVLPPGTVPASYLGEAPGADLAPLLRWAGAPLSAEVTGPVARIAVRGGYVLAGTPDLPLAWRTTVGQGSVLALAIDPGRAGPGSAGSAAAIVGKAIDPMRTASAPLQMALQQRRGQPSLLGLVETLPAGVYPGWPAVALVLGGFALLVGPILHILLGRMDRRSWSWLAVPAFAVVVTGMLYLVGVGPSGGDVVGNVYTHVLLEPERGTARQTVAAGFYAPMHAPLRLTVPGATAVRAAPNPYGQPSVSGGIEPNAEPILRVDLDDDTRVAVATGRFTMRSVAYERTLGREVGSITSAITVRDGQYAGTVRNDTPYHLEDAAVAIRQNVARLGDLAPGQTASFVLDPRRRPATTAGAVSVSAQVTMSAEEAKTLTEEAPETSAPYGYAGYPYGYGGPPGDTARLPGGYEAQRRSRLIDTVIPRYSQVPGGPATRLELLAFTREPVGDGMPTAGAHPTTLLALLEQRLRIFLDPGPFTLPMGFVAGERLGGNPPEVSGQRASQLFTGTTIYQFRPGLPENATVERITVATQQWPTSDAPSGPFGARPMPSRLTPPETPPGPAEADTFFIYDWQAEGWDALPAGSEASTLDGAAKYVGPEGIVEVEIRTPPGQMLFYVRPQIAIEGTAR